MKNIVVIVPAKNEVEGIGVVISELKDSGIGNIMIVDGSDDDTAYLAKSMGAIVVDELGNGYGSAYKTGFMNVAKDIDAVVCMDGDGTYPSDAVNDLVKMLYDEDIDFISCARDYGRVMGLKHRFGNKVLTFFCNALFGVNLLDSQSGMWVFRRNVIDEIDLECDGMAFSEEIKLKVIKGGLRFREVPIEYRERVGEPVLDSYSDGIRNLLYLFKLRFWS